MPQTVEVRFKGTRRGFFVWADDHDPLRVQDAVVVELERGQDLGRVSSSGEAALRKCSGCTTCGLPSAGTEHPAGAAAGEADPPELGEPPAPPARVNGPATRRVLRRATPEDIGQADELRRAEEGDRRKIIERVRHHGLDMKVSDVEWQWDRNKLTVYFTAEKRVDFRALVRDLAACFHTRIELRQIGVRDEAARLGGVGRCGRAYCCSTWLTALSPVSLALAKDQHLSLNPAQISGGCGRLLCCLKYEHEFYVAARKRFPREGKTLQTLRGPEKVIAVDIFRERVFLKSEEHGARIIPLVDLRAEQEARAADPAGQPAPPAPRRAELLASPPVPPLPAPPQPPAPAGDSAAAAAPPARAGRRRRRRRRGPPGPQPPSAPPAEG